MKGSEWWGGHRQRHAALGGQAAESCRGEDQASGEVPGGVQGGAGAGVVQRAKMSLEVSTMMLPKKWLHGLRQRAGKYIQLLGWYNREQFMNQRWLEEAGDVLGLYFLFGFHQHCLILFSLIFLKRAGLLPSGNVMVTLHMLGQQACFLYFLIAIRKNRFHVSLSSPAPLKLVLFSHCNSEAQRCLLPGLCLLARRGFGE